MIRITVFVLLLLLVWGCDGREKPLGRAGPEAAHAAQRSDSSAATTRRVLEKADYYVSLSQDGARMSYTEWDSGNVVIRDLATGAVRNITHNTAPYKPGFGMNPRISPDGKSVVYSWQPEKDNTAQLHVAGVDGSRPRTIYEVKTATEVYPEDWSPDGRAVLATRSQEDGTKQIVLVPMDGGTVRVLKTFDWRQPMRMNFSPDGRFIVYDFPTDDKSNLHRDLFVLDLASNREHRLVQHPANDYLLGWGPDARHVLFASDRAGTLGAWLQEVENGRPKGAAVLVKPDLWNATLGQFIANGSFFYGVQTVNRQVHLATLDPSSGRVSSAPTSVTPSPLGRVGDPQWSPDGRSVSYISQSRAFTSSTIMIRALETAEVREIPVPHDLKYSFHRWARDGKSLILSGVPKGRTGLFRMDLQTTQTTPVFMLDRETVFPGGRTFEITPDGLQAVYVKNFIPAGRTSVMDLVVRDLTSQSERVLYRPAKPQIGLSMPLSPDGSMVAFAEGYERPELKVLPLQGDSPRKIGGDFMPRGNTPIAWSADGRALFVVRGVTGPSDFTKNEIWRVPLDGGSPTPIGVVEESITELRLDPSGRRLAFAFGNASGELWVMERILPRASQSARTRR